MATRTGVLIANFGSETSLDPFEGLELPGGPHDWAAVWHSRAERYGSPGWRPDASVSGQVVIPARTAVILAGEPA